MCSFASEISMAVGEDDEAFHALVAPIKRILTAPIPARFSSTLKDAMSPDVDKITSVVRVLIVANPVAVKT